MSLFQKSINDFQRRVAQGLRNTTKYTKFSIFVPLSLAFLVGAPSQVETAFVVASPLPESQIQMKLDTTSPFVIQTSSSTPIIVPGESVAQKEARVKLEAAEAARLASIAKQKRNTVSRERRVYSDPSNFEVIYQNAGAAYGVDWKLLKAIHTVETGASGSTARSNPSGATGPMQFLPSTFRAHAVDGNQDGIKDITNVEDAIYSAASYLVACGYPNEQKALWGYNPSKSYYNKIEKLKNSF